MWISRPTGRAAYREPVTDPAAVAGALATELHVMANWLGMDAVAVERRGPFAGALAAAVRDYGGI